MFRNLNHTKAISFFLLSLSIFTYQNLLGPTFSTLLTGLWQAWVAIPCFLGIGFGLWLSVTFFTKRFDSEKTERLATHILFFSFIFAFLILNHLSHKVDQELLSVASSLDQIKIIEKLTTPILINYVPIFLSLIALPFIFFGIILGCQFSRPQRAIKAYQLELLGLIAGSFLCLWLLEDQSWVAVVMALVGLSLSALIFYELSFTTTKIKILIHCAPALLIFITFISNSSSWQLQRNLNLVTRDFHQRKNVQALATRWKSFAKVQLLETTQGLSRRKLISIGDGTGIAKFFSYDTQNKDYYDLLTVNLASFSSPKKVAVLFAGAGAELIGLHKKLGADVKTWGVEINSAIPALVAQSEGENWTRFFKKYNSQYVISDNRRFLETSSEKFDSIIYSWSGATMANFSGAILHTTQYSFTVEALDAATKRLESNGTLIVVGGNKLNIIKNLKLLESKGSLENIRNKILIFSPWANIQWKNSWDDYILVYKNRDWTADEVKLISASAGGLASLIVNPNEDLSETAAPYQKMLASSDIDDFSRSLWAEEKVLPTNATDDYPFAYRNYPSLLAQDRLDLLSIVSNSIAHPYFTAVDGIVWIGLIFIIFLMISLLKKDLSLSPGLLQFLAWAPISSSCLLFYLYKAILYFGDPSVAFIIVQVATQLGSLLGLHWANKNKMTTGTHAVFLAAILILASQVLLMENQSISSFLFHLNLYVTEIFFFFMICLLSCLVSFYFLSRLLTKTEIGSKNFGLFWTFETLFTGLTSLCGAFLIEEQGIKFFVLSSIVFSCALLLMGNGLKRFNHR